MTETFTCGHYVLDLSQPIVMGILNVTPDSFSDGGKFNQFNTAIRHAESMVAEGAGIIDIGGESTRPGAQAVSVQQELDRVIPLVEKLAGELDVPVSVDTSKAQVMSESASAGAGMINDVMALQNEDALQVVASLDSSIAICLMHMQGQPRTMQQNPQYGDVVRDIYRFLERRVEDCVAAGISRERLCIDPGFGFGKTLEHNLSLLKNSVKCSCRFWLVCQESPCWERCWVMYRRNNELTRVLPRQYWLMSVERIYCECMM